MTGVHGDVAGHLPVINDYNWLQDGAPYLVKLVYNYSNHSTVNGGWCLASYGKGKKVLTHAHVVFQGVQPLIVWRGFFWAHTHDNDGDDGDGADDGDGDDDEDVDGGDCADDDACDDDDDGDDDDDNSDDDGDGADDGDGDDDEDVDGGDCADDDACDDDDDGDDDDGDDADDDVFDDDDDDDADADDDDDDNDATSTNNWKQALTKSYQIMGGVTNLVFEDSDSQTNACFNAFFFQWL